MWRVGGFGFGVLLLGLWAWGLGFGSWYLTWSLVLASGCLVFCLLVVVFGFWFLGFWFLDLVG